MENIRGMQEYWASLDPVDRSSLLETLYIDPEFGKCEWTEIPGHIRSILYRKYDSVWKDIDYEFTV
jgi:hypothetical protein